MTRTVPLDLSIVIVNWNVRELLHACLRSILQAATADPGDPYVWHWPDAPRYSFEVIVVDSASSDDSVASVQKDFPSVRLHASSVNLGYARGNNVGIQESAGRFVLLLNPDTQVLDGALPYMLDYLESHPQVGVLGPQLLYADGSVQPSRRRFPTLATALIESTFLQTWFPHHPALRQYYVRDRPDNEISEVDWVIGACLLVRREAIAQAGLLDEGFFMYSEELDWQRRIRTAGWKVVYFPTAQVLHYEGKSSEQAIALRHIRFQESKVRYFTKYHGQRAAGIVRRWLLLHYAWEWSIEALKWLLGHKRALRRERMHAYAQVLRTRLLV